MCTQQPCPLEPPTQSVPLGPCHLFPLQLRPTPSLEVSDAEEGDWALEQDRPCVPTHRPPMLLPAPTLLIWTV